MTNIRKQYAKLKIPLLQDIEKVISGKKEDYENKTYKDLRNYPVCIVGTVREKLGLSPIYNNYYIADKENKEFCLKCGQLADQFPDPLEMYQSLTGEDLNSYYNWRNNQEKQEYKEKYEALLIELKQHLVLDHKKRIDI